MLDEEEPLDVGSWDGAFGPPFEVSGGSMSAPLEVDCALPAWSWERQSQGVSIVRTIIGGT